MTNKDYIYNYLTKEMKLNKSGAIGIMSNIYHESGYKTDIHGDGGTSYGICQWHKSRYNNLKSYCSKNGLNYKSIEGQMKYLDYELNKSYKSVLKYIKGVSNDSTGAYNSAYYFCTKFERPQNKEEKGKQRGNYAIKLYTSYNVSDIPKETPKNESINEIAKEVIKGKYGNGEERKKKLGSLYDEVQAEVNRILRDKEGVTHIVKKGEYVYKLARMYNVKASDIIKRNNLKAPLYIIRTGQKLVIK